MFREKQQHYHTFAVHVHNVLWILYVLGESVTYLDSKLKDNWRSHYKFLKLLTSVVHGLTIENQKINHLALYVGERRELSFEGRKALREASECGDRWRIMDLLCQNGASNIFLNLPMLASCVVIDVYQWYSAVYNSYSSVSVFLLTTISVHKLIT